MSEKWLINCEKSGVIRNAMRNLGIDAWSCDIEPSVDSSPYHIQADAIETAYNLDYAWDGMVFHPECTYLSNSGIHWNSRVYGRHASTLRAINFALKGWNAPIGKIAMENPRGQLGSVLGKSQDTVQPYEFGDDASKETRFWLKNLKPLERNPFLYLPGRKVVNSSGKTVQRWENQTDSGQNRLPPSADRSAKRAQTYPGIAKAIAEQWPTR